MGKTVRGQKNAKAVKSNHKPHDCEDGTSGVGGIDMNWREYVTCPLNDSPPLPLPKNIPHLLSPSKFAKELHSYFRYDELDNVVAEMSLLDESCVFQRKEARVSPRLR